MLSTGSVSCNTTERGILSLTLIFTFQRLKVGTIDNSMQQPLLINFTFYIPPQKPFKGSSCVKQLLDDNELHFSASKSCKVCSTTLIKKQKRKKEAIVLFARSSYLQVGSRDETLEFTEDRFYYITNLKLSKRKELIQWNRKYGAETNKIIGRDALYFSIKPI
ncbi:conserved hypothetical protein [Trichinella spiralis]|uniref:hypothetical protein n=1 Tax=Trichinella spiralis TaxID=6334 RepID=UPI0001EFE4A5|nr:conserved hypothetical protein [Trichinella spiralis]